MPSPFPGMDPYIESPEIWVDFHSDLAAEIRAHLNRVIRPRYFANMAPYVTYELIESGETHSIRPDVGLQQSSATTFPEPTSVAVITPAPVLAMLPPETPLTLYRVEVRTAAEKRLVTVIEILSPVNKRFGHAAYTDYLNKREALLRSSVHLLELDLLRGGTRLPLEGQVPVAPYYVTLSRAQRRPTAEIWPIQLADRLPVLPVPLVPPDADAPLDLGTIVSAIYERAAYDVQIDYQRLPPPPSLTSPERRWLDDLLASHRAPVA